MDTSTMAIDGTYTDEDIDRLLGLVQSDRAGRGLSWEAIAKEIGVNGGTLSSFASTWPKRTFQGNAQKIAAAISKWKADEEARKRSARLLPNAPDFIHTPTAQAVDLSLRYAQFTPAITTLVGVPGIGKTKAAERYRADHANVILVTMEPMTRGAGMMLSEIAHEMGLDEKCQAKLPRTIGRQLKGSGTLIIVDEAQHLDLLALDQLRSLYDKYTVAIALLGNPKLATTIDGKRDNSTAQIKSRMGMRRTRNGLMKGDACALIDGWGVTDDKARDELKRIAAKPGALRNIHMVMTQLSLAAQGADEPLKVTPELIRAVWADLHPTERGAV